VIKSWTARRADPNKSCAMVTPRALRRGGDVCRRSECSNSLGDGNLITVLHSNCTSILLRYDVVGFNVPLDTLQVILGRFYGSNDPTNSVIDMTTGQTTDAGGRLQP